MPVKQQFGMYNTAPEDHNVENGMYNYNDRPEPEPTAPNHNATQKYVEYNNAYADNYIENGL